jgi:hypothetical protein
MDDRRPDDPHGDVSALRRALVALLPGIALAEGASAQDAATAQPSSYRVAFENDRLRVLEYRSRPGMGVCGTGMHSHPAHLTVVLFDGKVRARESGGAWKTAEGKLGDVFWSEAETHEVENISGRNGRALLIELKEQPRKG